jgi:uncharacterized protein YndB with AHSA1/START domain
MTTQKDFKRLVRGRMQKTGESYTAARARLLNVSAKRQTTAGDGETKKPRVESNGQRPAPAAPVAPELAKIAGMSDATIKEKTGCTWDRWVWALDEVGAFNWPHGEIARYVHEKYNVPGWWTQTVTVGYERIKGLRARGQRRSGSWEASKSKTFDVSVGTVFKSFKQPKLRSEWLGDRKIAIRTAVPNKSMRITWDDGTSVEVYFTSKGRSKSSVAVQHTRLPGKDVAERSKAFWSEQLDRLAERLRPKARKGAGT